MEEPQVTCELDKHLKNIADAIKGESQETLEAKENLAKWLEYIVYCIVNQDADMVSEVNEL